MDESYRYNYLSTKAIIYPHFLAKMKSLRYLLGENKRGYTILIYYI